MATAVRDSRYRALPASHPSSASVQPAVDLVLAVGDAARVGCGVVKPYENTPNRKAVITSAATNANSRKFMSVSLIRGGSECVSQFTRRAKQGYFCWEAGCFR
jgi:hypothetical protein